MLSLYDKRYLSNRLTHQLRYFTFIQAIFVTLSVINRGLTLAEKANISNNLAFVKKGLLLTAF